MGREFELKYRATAEQQTAIRAKFNGFREIAMETTYFDTPDSSLSARKMTLRLRKENAVTICTLKTPLPDGSRGEWECEATDIAAGVQELVTRLVRDEWNYNKNAALVVGATYPEELKELREMCPELPFLVPGVGAQGGDVEKVVKFGCDNGWGGIIVNSSRGIIYASKGADFAEKSGIAARELRDLINSFR